MHNMMVVTCLITSNATGMPTKETRIYGMMTVGLLRLLGLLIACFASNHIA